ncbi:VasL domain-containing protein [Pluralibacter sp.]|uniref:VasL domain-containing protein n=1 Tax=Pluralibacter sp. TaxID=1920032 RepID=UPI0025FD6220|nr:VasL domain-containing protein [Pluralibacter sp.]MBV8041533.1 type VI secretion system ImpA family N-terminal domain-containing protein [Pluralibacter sp.]
MTWITERHLRTGGDPRTLADYALLRDELNKLAHPARPDVNWRQAEKLCLSLFEQNGVELQTAAWYTLARTHLTGLHGMNEGLALLEALISRQWGNLWPPQTHARMEILSAVSKRLQQVMRTLTLTYADLSQLYQAEKTLTRLGDVLQRLELKHLSQFDTLRTQMHTSAVRLENSEGAPENTPQPVGALIAEPDERVKWVYIAEPQPNVAVMTERTQPATSWKPFVAGALSMLVVGGVALWGWQALNPPDPALRQLAASLEPLPTTLSTDQLQRLQQKSPSPEEGIKKTRQQLERLARLSPDWSIRYSKQLIQQALTLWPEQALPLAAQWRQQQNAAVLPVEKLNGWHQGMSQLQQLTQRLNALDEKRGKYMTVSELKSEVFTIMQAFNSTIPAEEYLRQLAQMPPEQPLSTAQITQAEMSLETLLSLYSQIADRK